MEADFIAITGCDAAQAAQYLEVRRLHARRPAVCVVLWPFCCVLVCNGRSPHFCPPPASPAAPQPQPALPHTHTHPVYFWHWFGRVLFRVVFVAFQPQPTEPLQRHCRVVRRSVLYAALIPYPTSRLLGLSSSPRFFILHGFSPTRSPRHLLTGHRRQP